MERPSSEEYLLAMEERLEQSKKQLKFVGPQVLLFMALCTVGIVLYVSSQNSSVNSDGIAVPSFAKTVLAPFLIAAAAYYVVLLVALVFLATRCPKCRRLFPRNKLELYTVIDRTTTGSDGVVTSSSARIYCTECKYCGSVIWVAR